MHIYVAQNGTFSIYLDPMDLLNVLRNKVRCAKQILAKYLSRLFLNTYTAGPVCWREWIS